MLTATEPLGVLTNNASCGWTNNSPRTGEHFFAKAKKMVTVLLTDRGMSRTLARPTSPNRYTHRVSRQCVSGILGIGKPIVSCVRMVVQLLNRHTSLNAFNPRLGRSQRSDSKIEDRRVEGILVHLKVNKIPFSPKRSWVNRLSFLMVRDPPLYRYPFQSRLTFP